MHLKITQYTITDKTGSFSQVSIYHARRDPTSPWCRSTPMVSTPQWAIRIEREQAASLLQSARKTNPVWEMKVRKEVSYWPR
jgi:hypothetical protein